MAYVTARSGGTWEVRESHLTADGPRSRTLATFKILTPEVMERAIGRSSKQLSPMELRTAARRVGAPIAQPCSDRAAAELLAELTAGRRPRGVLARLLLRALRAQDDEPADNIEAAAAWMSASPERRGETLRDLLLLVDSLPSRRRRERARFPRIESKLA